MQQRFTRQIATVLTDLYGPESDVHTFDLANVGDVIGKPERYTHWTAHLWRLMLRADTANLARLAAAFPKHFEVLQAWQQGIYEDPPVDPRDDRYLGEKQW